MPFAGRPGEGDNVRFYLTRPYGVERPRVVLGWGGIERSAASSVDKPSGRELPGSEAVAREGPCSRQAAAATIPVVLLESWVMDRDGMVEISAIASGSALAAVQRKREATLLRRRCQPGRRPWFVRARIARAERCPLPRGPAEYLLLAAVTVAPT